MPLSMYQASVPVFVRFLSNLDAFIEHAAETYAKQNIAEGPILDARLFPDMFTLAEQVRQATYHAVHCVATLADSQPPSLPEDISSFAALRARVAAALAWLETVAPDSLEGSEVKPVKYMMMGKPHDFQGDWLLLMHCMPNFMFHVTTAYDLLRHNGLSMGKRHFMGYFKPGT